MTEQHPITPLPELIEQWRQDTLPGYRIGGVIDFAITAARWGADQELEACCEWLKKGPYGFSIAATAPCMTGRLRADRRPKLSSLADQATTQLDEAVMRGDCITTTEAMPVLRAALERLKELEQVNSQHS